MGNGAIAISLAREFHLTMAEKRRYAKPFQDLTKQGRHDESIKGILQRTLIEDRATMNNNSINPLNAKAKGSAKQSSNSSSLRPSTAGKASVKSQPAALRSPIRPSTAAKASLKAAATAQKERPPSPSKVLTQEATGTVADDSLADNSEPTSPTDLSPTTRVYTSRMKRNWTRVARRLRWQAQLDKSVARLFPFGNFCRRIPMCRFRCLFAGTIHTWRPCNGNVNGKSGSDGVAVSRELYLCIVLHEAYEERKFVPGLSPIIEIIGINSSTWTELMPRLFISVSVLRSLLLQQLHSQVHASMKLRYPELTGFGMGDAAKAVSVAAQAAIMNCAKQATTQAVANTHIDTVVDTHQVEETHEKSRFAMWFDRVQHRRVSTSKVAAGEFVAGIRRGSRSYTTLLSGINDGVRALAGVGSAGASRVNESQGLRALPHNLQQGGAVEQKQHTVCGTAEQLQDARNDFVNSVVYDCMVTYITANLRVCVPQGKAPSWPMASLFNGTKFGKMQSMPSSSDAQAERLVLEPPVIPKNVYGSVESDEDAACLSHKESLFVPEHICHRFICPVRVEYPKYAMSANHLCEGLKTTGDVTTGQGLSSQFELVAQDFSDLAESVVENTGLASAHIGLHGAVYECSRDNLNDMHKWDAKGTFHPALGDNRTLHYDEISKTLCRMLEGRLASAQQCNSEGEVACTSEIDSESNAWKVKYHKTLNIQRKVYDSKNLKPFGNENDDDSDDTGSSNDF
jgi:hypothetical protein